GLIERTQISSAAARPAEAADQSAFTKRRWQRSDQLAQRRRRLQPNFSKGARRQFTQRFHRRGKSAPSAAIARRLPERNVGCAGKRKCEGTAGPLALLRFYIAKSLRAVPI